MIIELSQLAIESNLLDPEGLGKLKARIAKVLEVSESKIMNFEITRRSIDARKKPNVKCVLTLKVDIPSMKLDDLEKLQRKKAACIKLFESKPKLSIPDVSCLLESNAKRPIVVGSGPAGLFCSLYLSRAGMKPLIIERGEPVEQRALSVQKYFKEGILNTESNVQFGEGGAGTFSDGKLTTGKNSPFNRFILETFVEAGAPQDILIDAKPHIGTDYLYKVIPEIRKSITNLGGEVRFNTRFESFVSVNGGITSVRLMDQVSGDVYEEPCGALIVAIGHSARDTFGYLQREGIKMERKPFAMGARIEHPQAYIDKLQYGKEHNEAYLPAADYKLAVRTKEDRGVYTFCMCPGGEVVAAASESEGVCTNGMSNHDRDGRNANSALLVEVAPDDLPGTDVLEGIKLQREVERRAFKLAGSNHLAPSQKLGSFLHQKIRQASQPYFDELKPTYEPGVSSVDLHEVFPKFISDALEEGIVLLDKKMRGFAHPDALLTAPEARSSSPVRLVRDKLTLQSVSMDGLYPAGEGAGYAGGIMSAAADGLIVASRIVAEVIKCASINAAIARLRAGYPVIFPTDTVYGLGLSVNNNSSPKALYDLKKRDGDKPIAWLIGSIDDLAKYGRDVPQYAYDLAEEGWPGSLTLIVKASSEVPQAYRSKEGTIGLRIPDSKTARLLIEATGPIAATSANISGEEYPKGIEDIPNDLLDNVIYIEDDQEVLSNKPSQVIDCTGEEPKLIRT